MHVTLACRISINKFTSRESDDQPHFFSIIYCISNAGKQRSGDVGKGVFVSPNF